MAKYSYEFKKKIVDEYNNNAGGYKYLAEKYGFSDTKLIRKWIANYNFWGDQGLIRSRANTIYSFEKKLSVVELYLSSEISYQKLALQEGITSSSIIARWVSDFRKFGPEGLRTRKKGRKKTVDSQEEKFPFQSAETSGIDTSVEHVKQLEDELYKLRLENAFLKELRRLRLEDEAKMRERHVSSTVSEDSSN